MSARNEKTFVGIVTVLLIMYSLFLVACTTSSQIATEVHVQQPTQNNSAIIVAVNKSLQLDSKEYFARNTTAKPVIQLCPNYIDPICATDGKTYKNTCELKVAKATFLYFGVCDRNTSLIYGTQCPNTDGFICSLRFITIQSSCLAKYKGMPVITNGSCVLPSPEYVPCVDTTAACGIDGKTYANICVAKERNITIAHEGVCAKIN